MTENNPFSEIHLDLNDESNPNDVHGVELSIIEFEDNQNKEAKLLEYLKQSEYFQKLPTDLIKYLWQFFALHNPYRIYKLSWAYLMFRLNNPFRILTYWACPPRIIRTSAGEMVHRSSFEVNRIPRTSLAFWFGLLQKYEPGLDRILIQTCIDKVLNPHYKYCILYPDHSTIIENEKFDFKLNNTYYLERYNGH